jgi:hypothetical protein
MDEGVDPPKMCQSLVEKVTHSEQLRAVSDPEILVLFEDWLEELEGEVISLAKKEDQCLYPSQLAHRLGISQAGATFLLAKLKREGRLYPQKENSL